MDTCQCTCLICSQISFIYIGEKGHTQKNIKRVINIQKSNNNNEIIVSYSEDLKYEMTFSSLFFLHVGIQRHKQVKLL